MNNADELRKKAKEMIKKAKEMESKAYQEFGKVVLNEINNGSINNVELIKEAKKIGLSVTIKKDETL